MTTDDANSSAWRTRFPVYGAAMSGNSRKRPSSSCRLAGKAATRPDSSIQSCI